MDGFHPGIDRVDVGFTKSKDVEATVARIREYFNLLSRELQQQQQPQITPEKMQESQRRVGLLQQSINHACDDLVAFNAVYKIEG